MSSENEDDPQIYEDSGSDWEEEKPKKRGGGRRSSTRNAKKPKKSVAESESEEEEEEDEDEDEEEEEESDEDAKPKKKNGANKKKKIDRSAAAGGMTPPNKNIPTQEYATGSFLIAKKDIQVGDKKKKPCIWRVDGKALLQKYEAFDDEGKTRHRTTSVYTGWSSLDKDMYAPVKVTVYRHSNHSMVVDLDWDQLKSINIDSD